MINKQLIDYIAEQLRVDTSVDDIKKSLINSGWSQNDIDEAFRSLPTVAPVAQPVPVTVQPASVDPIEPKKRSKMGVVLYLILFCVIVFGGVGLYCLFISMFTTKGSSESDAFQNLGTALHGGLVLMTVVPVATVFLTIKLLFTNFTKSTDKKINRSFVVKFCLVGLSTGILQLIIGKLLSVSIESPNIVYVPYIVSISDIVQLTPN